MERVCERCGGVFTGRRDAKYCRKCRNHAGRRHTEVIALRVSAQIKRKFQALPSGRKRKLLAYLRTVLEAGLEITEE
ncbi:MAG: hypothetical protein L3J76_01230 [Candidatus Hydrothermae bacterium]|nr:hypothetical protein [Candidatus Hydrothermae bacterium]